MRESLTIFAILVILALSALLVGPYFIDWNHQRAWISARLSASVGAKVKIAGPIEVRLLPVPIFRIKQVSIAGDAPLDPQFRAETLDAELSINGLLQGSVQFVDATVDAPRLDVTMRSDGSIVTPAWSVENPQRFEFKHVTVNGGTVAINREDGTQRLLVSGIDAVGEADTLFGPLKLSGKADGAKGKLAFRFNTGAYGSRKLRVKLSLDSLAALASNADVEGTVSLGSASADGHVPLGFEGSVDVAGHLHVADGASPVPWRLVASAVKADAHGMTGTALELRAGGDGRALVATGVGVLDLGANPSLALQLQARQLDLDRIAVPPGVAPDTPRPTAAQWVAALNDHISAPDLFAGVPVQLSFDYRIDAVTTADLTLTDAVGHLDAKPGQPLAMRFAIKGPNETHLALDGTVEPGAAAVFKGHAEASTRDLATVADRLAPALPEAADFIKAHVPVGAFTFSGGLDLSKIGFSARDVTLTADGSSLNGTLSFTRAVGDSRARLFADLTADTLDAEHLPNLNDLAASVSPLDLVLAVSAKAVKLSRTGLDTVEAGRLALHLTKTGDAITLDQFSVAGVGGATITASASLDGNKVARMQGHVEAKAMTPLAVLVRQVAPNAATTFLVEHGALLSPMSLNFKAEGTLGDDGTLTPSLAVGDGTFGATRLSGTITPEPARTFEPATLNALLVMDAPDAGALFRQWGLTTVAAGSLGASHLEATARGTVQTGFDTHAVATLPDTALTFEGQIASGTGTGHLKANGANAAGLLRNFAGAMPPSTAVWPWATETDVSWHDGRADAARISGRFASTTFSGSLGYAPPPVSADAAPDAALTGALTLDTLPLSAVTGLILGSANPAQETNAHWSNAKFGAAATPLPRAAVGLTVGTLELTNGVTAHDATLTLKLAPSSLTLADMSGHALGGQLASTMTLRRDGPTASLAGQISFSDVAVDLPNVAAHVSGTMTLAGTGGSPDALIGSLAGDGTVRIIGAKTPRLDPGALNRVAAALDVDGSTVDDAAAREALMKALDRGSLILGDLSAPTTLAAGTLRLTGMQSKSPDATAVSEAAFDLRSFSQTLQTVLTASILPKDWKGDAPQVTVTWKGSLDSPDRAVDAASFVNGLEARAIARDQDRIQLMQDDLRERGFFARQLRQIEAEQQAARTAAQQKTALPAIKVPDIRLPKAPDVLLPTETPGLKPNDPHAAPDSISKLLDATHATPLPPTRPSRPFGAPTKPVDLQPPTPAQSTEAFEHVAPSPNATDPAAAGRY